MAAMLYRPQCVKLNVKPLLAHHYHAFSFACSMFTQNIMAWLTYSCVKFLEYLVILNRKIWTKEALLDLNIRKISDGLSILLTH